MERGFFMKEEMTQDIQASGAAKTDPILVKAYKMLSAYAQATGTMICVHDHNYQAIPETADDILVKKNICLCCTRFRTGVEVKNIQDLNENPCREMHINAFRESQMHGGSHIYTCDMGFIFWTSPVYREGRFIGGLLGTGFLSIDKEETIRRISNMAKGELAPEEIRSRIDAFPRIDMEKAKALAEIMLLYAESLSTGSEDYHETLRRRAEQQSNIAAQVEELKLQYPPGTALPGYPLDKERMLLASLRRGDNEAGKKILTEILAILLFSTPDHFKTLQFRAIELAVLLSRADISPGYTEKAVLETNNYYLKRIQESQTVEELIDVLYITVDRMAGQIFSFQGIRHASALRKADRYIWENYTRKISLQEIAEASGLSAPYFSTIFKDEMGENLSSYLNRLRVEKASRMLLETDLSLSEIAGSCGFEDQSWFSKIFKSYTGMSPGKYRGQGGGIIQEISEDNLSADYRTILSK
jgi:AraC-like DNA-binding protein/ligand-binding sensor protein